ncbi:MAG: hypothetical protein SFZ24_05295, partial [Planctomycetota bacterium]|nr:hypothetical protein [Planctomycetota bacterium]
SVAFSAAGAWASSGAIVSHGPLADIAEPDSRVGFGTLTIDVSNTSSMDNFGDPDNARRQFFVGRNNILTGIGWNVVLQTVTPNSGIDELIVWFSNRFENPYTAGFGLRPGGGLDGPAGPTAFSSPMLKLQDVNVPDLHIGPDGILTLEYADQPDNAPGQADGLWISGTITLQFVHPVPPVPAPASAAALLLLAAPRRSRRLAR